MNKLMSKIRFRNTDKLFNKVTKEHLDYINEQAPELRGDLISSLENQINAGLAHHNNRSSETFDELLKTRKQTNKEYENITLAVFSKGYAQGQEAGDKLAAATLAVGIGIGIIAGRVIKKNKTKKKNKEEEFKEKLNK